eukprot:TRINITY_DN1900_c0_g1_i5.p1 TRINITY_DN1900_c0_g1~~TRINITY_DN1900_c0_g1_i5.p1  ORF type:complete len:186 (-),score=17.29 TRINITY_DN1900_c0_g1_i5:33-590(-)
MIWIFPYFGVFGILGFGYDRFFYAGTIEQFNSSIQFNLLDFFHSSVFYNLLVIGIFFVPGIIYPMVVWGRNNTKIFRNGKLRSLYFLLIFWTMLIILTGVGFVVYDAITNITKGTRFAHVYIESQKGTHEGGLGCQRYDPLVGFVGAELAAFLLIAILILLIPLNQKVQKRITKKAHIKKKMKNK